METARKTLGSVVVALLGLSLLAALVVVVLDDQETPGASQGGLNLAAVPAAYRQFLLDAGQQCPEVSAPLLAAQIEAESNWNPSAVSPVGAQGLTQFMPGTWAAYGVDADGDGRADPFTPADAIAAQARYMCALVPHVEGIAAATGSSLVDLLLAAYNAGPGAVAQYRGIPPYTETRNYVAKINRLIAKYTAPVAVGGGWRDPVLGQFTRGTRFWEPGRLWAWKGHHTGVDYRAAIGTRVGAAGPGTVKEIRSGGSYGNHVIIDHGRVDGHRIETLYAHLSGFANIRVGQPVQAGDLIGYVGNTGNTTGPHLHFEVRRDWTGGSNNNEFVDGFAWIDAHRAAPPLPAGGDNYELGAVKPHVKYAAEVIGPMFGVKTIGGYRSVGSVPGSLHPAGRALDFMIQGTSAARLSQLAAYAVQNRARYGITEVIWNRQIWTLRRASEGWRPYDGPSPHTDHVHLSFNTSGGG